MTTVKIYAVMKGGEILDISTCERETREIAETCCGSMVELVPRESAPATAEREIAAKAINDAAQYAQDWIEKQGAVTPQSTAALDAVQAYANSMEKKS